VGVIATLLIGVASTVVPMFWQTVRPSPLWQRSLPGLLWLPLLLVSTGFFWQFPLLTGCLIVALFSVLGMRAVWHAKRRFDPAWILWMACTTSWFTASVLTAVISMMPERLPTVLAEMLSWWIGVLALVGGAVLPVNAMLGKIIPFLVFLHLRRQTPPGQRVPAMQVVMPPQRLKWQARLVLLALLVLLILPLAPEALATIAGIIFAASQALMGMLLVLTLLRYRRELRPFLLS
jgi:hypothetical protein